jgi:excisionase family DNA binding protein
MEHLMTSEEVAEILHVDPVTIRRLVAKGEMAAYRIGSDYRFAPSDLEQYLERQRIPAAEVGEQSSRIAHDVFEQILPWLRNVTQGKHAGLAGLTGRFDRFTERARKVMTLSKEEALRFQHNYIGTEHLLLGLVREGQGVAAQVLKNLGVELESVRKEVEFILGRGDHVARSTGEIGLTPRAGKAIELAVDEARRLGHHYIGTEHMLLGLIREGEGIAAGVLDSLGVKLEQARTETRRVLSQLQQASVPSEPEQTDVQSAEAEQTQTCGQCGTVSPINFRYCHNCGHLLIPEEPESGKEA